MEPQHIGIPWYTADDYAAARALMLDAEKLPERFEDWLSRAEALRQQQIAQGRVAIKAHIRSTEFAAWCRRHHVDCNANGRMLFANAAAYDAHVKSRKS